ncbi:MAG TPA: glycosyl transferase family 1 [Bacteroidales bacterium]|nr:glycosyl transferase family 1 [Bacteroidales bacterium]
MKVLFVGSANRDGEPNPVVLNQGSSLIRGGMDLRYYGVRGKGLTGYLRNIISLRKEIANFKPDIVHAHYVLSGVVSSLAGAKPLVVSLMGSDVLGGRTQRVVSGIFGRFFWDACIVKTGEMKNLLGLNHVHVVPNGVDFDHFRPLPREEALAVAGWDGTRINILFPSDPARPEKNFRLAEDGVKAMDNERVSLHVLGNVPRDRVVWYLNAADAILITSHWEGSPNIVKEAMACNRPVVSTMVGDVGELFAGAEGCYAVRGNADEIASSLYRATAIRETNGRESISGLDSRAIALRLEGIYSELLA